MPENTHQCARPGCATTVPKQLYACRACWYTLPQDIRDAINAGWRHRTRTGDASEHRRATVRAVRYWIEQDAASADVSQ